MKPLSLSKPHVIVMVGIPGSGKSFFAEHFADTFSAPYVSIDRLRAELFNDPTFDANENEIIDRVSDYMLDELYKSQRTIVLDVATGARTERQDIVKKAHGAGYEPLFVWVQTESVAARQRATKRAKGKTSLTSEQFDAAVRHFTPPNASERAVVISGKHTYASQLKIVLKRLVEPRADMIDGRPAAPRPTDGRHIAVR